MSYSEGGYYSEFGDSIKSKVMYIKINNSKLYFGLSSDGMHLRNLKKRHNITIDENEMYLFAELEVISNSKANYPYFDIIPLRKDIALKDYHLYFKKNEIKCKEFLQNI
jgi:hypothetical protein